MSSQSLLPSRTTDGGGVSRGGVTRAGERRRAVRNNPLTNAANYGRRPSYRTSAVPIDNSSCCQRPSRETAVMLLFTVAAIMSSTFERVTFKIMIDTMKPFRLFVTQLVTLIYVPIMFAIVAYKKLRTQDILPEMEEFSKCKFAFMALLDVIHASIVTISGGIIPAPLTVLLLQSSVPATMFATRFFLGHKYKWTHYVSSFIILVGISIHMIPLVHSATNNVTPSNTSLTTPLLTSPLSFTTTLHNSTRRSNVNAPTTEVDVLYNCIIYLLCCIPGALSAIYKEYALQTQPMDMYYLNLWVTFFQFIILIPLAPIGFHYSSWSINSNDTNWSDFRHLFENIGLGVSCWLQGNNPPANYRDGTSIIGSEYASCEYALYLVLFYVACNLIFNVFVIILMRRGASLFQLNTSVILPIVFSYILLYLYNFIIVSNSIDSTKLGFNGTIYWENITGFIIVVLGLIMYRGAAKEPGTEYETEVGNQSPI